jgi:serine/threonine-protein kinase
VRFCPSCGAPQDPDLTQAITPDSPTVTAGSTRSTWNSGTGEQAARFVAGDVINHRYRVSDMLGKGGMGEVYRAEDLKLGQPVALKFLPPGLENNPDLLQRFLNEVRTARQVTHPNVCRVYDVDEHAGQHFLSMEYVDGEDLASALRRFGRLPTERAVEVARQICAGLAAAHDQGILHRDLKPANVMIDGKGRVKLTDFGLAGLADRIGKDDVRAGTPAYMSPEQITGQDVSVRSDIYALGLVLYELFTGQQAYKADTVADYRNLHTQSLPSHPTAVLPELDPVIERAIMRCLQKAPEDRPASALAVAAALPGGDPLQAALAAGETPSPELVAQAGQRDGLAGYKAWGLALVAILLLAGGTHWAGRMSVVNFVPLDKSPAVLMDRARDIVGQFGYVEEVYTHPADRAWGFLVWGDVITEVSQADSSAHPWDQLRERPDAMGFWYRQSPRLLSPEPVGGPALVRANVTLTNPMPSNAGEVLIVLDVNGRLRRFEVLPKRFSTRDPAEPDWSGLFTLAELDTARFRPVPPRYQRFMSPDIRRAWVGTRALQPDLEIRVEAGAFEGRPVLFNVATSASLASLGNEPSLLTRSTADWLQNTLTPLLILTVVIFAIRMSRRNQEQSRADVRGAVRFAAIVFFLSCLADGLGSHTLFSPDWADEIWPIFAGAVFVSMAAWGLYTAAEPLGRRIWPTMFISSSRLLSRSKVQWRDPLIGQSVLIGLIAAGLDFLVRGPVQWNLVAMLTDSAPILPWFNLSLLDGQRAALAHILDLGLMLSFIFIHIMALVLFEFLFKRRVVTIILSLLLWTMLAGPGNLPAFGLGLLSSAIMMVVLLRWGVVAFAMGRIALALAWTAKPADWTSWYSQGSVLIVVALALLAVYGAWAAQGQKSPAQG